MPRRQIKTQKKLVNGRVVYVRKVKVGGGFFNMSNLKKYGKLGMSALIPHAKKFLGEKLSDLTAPASDPIRNLAKSGSDAVFDLIQKKLADMGGPKSGSGVRYFQ